jgi:transposase, IS5 family
MGKYLGEEKNAPVARFCVAARSGAIKKMEDSPTKMLSLTFEKTKASICAKAEYLFDGLKDLFGYRRVRYKGLAKNQAQLFSLFALANLVLAGRCQRHADGVDIWLGTRITRLRGKPVT